MKQKAVMCLLALLMITNAPLESALAASGTGAVAPKNVSVSEMVEEHHNGSDKKEFSNGRIYTTEKNLSGSYNAKEISQNGNVTFLQYNTAAGAKRAYLQMKKDGLEVYPDTIVGKMDSSTSYSGDTLKMYNTAVKGAGGKISVTTDEEINGLPVAARNIVDSKADICQVGVAVIDTGLDTSNPVFSGRVLSGYSVSGGSTNDRYGHGTHVASIIANNTPNNVKLIPIKVTDDTGSFTMSGLASALAYVSEHSSEINVVNLSLSINTLDATQMDSISSYLDTYIDDLYNKGILIVTSAGNVNEAYSNFTADESYPANNDKTIAVSALTKSNGNWQLYGKSVTGNAVDFCAPGHNIRGVQASSMGMIEINESNGYKGEYLSLGDGTCIMNGTSQSAAFVTSALCDILSYDNSLPADKQREILERYATKSDIQGSSAGKDSQYGVGHPDMSAYTYSTGITNSDGSVRGLVDGWDVKVNNASGVVEYVRYTGSSDTATIPASVTINGRTYIVKVLGSNDVFGGNQNVKSVKVANGVTMSNVTGLSFTGCSSLMSVDRMPEGASDYSNAFERCPSISTIPDIPNGVTKMDGTFYGCKAIRGNVNIISPDVSSAKDIFGGGCADGFTITCPTGSTTEKTLLAELKRMKAAGTDKKIKINGQADQTVEAIKDYDVSYNETAKTVTLTKYKGNSTTITIPSTIVKNGVTYTVIIGKSTATSGPFANNKTLRNITLPSSIKVEDNDGRYMFYRCSALEKISCIPACVTDISYICYEDSSLKELPDVPEKVTKMDYAFYGCTAARGSQTIKAEGVTSATDAYKDDTITIYCVPDSVTYKTLMGLVKQWVGVTLKTNGASDSTKDNTTVAQKKYKVTFHFRNKKLNKSGTVKTSKVIAKDKVVQPKTPTVKGYALAGWYTKSGKKWNFSKQITSNVTLYAKWVSTKVATPKITYLKSNAKDSFDIKYTKCAGATGYQTKSSHFKNFQSSQEDGTNKLSKRMYLYKAGKTYVKVRAYKRINGKTYFGKWSKVKVVYAKY